MLHICTWLWGEKYGPEYVDRLKAGVERNLHQPYRFHVKQPDEEQLAKMPGCFPRLRMFDRGWQERQDFEIGDRLVCLDLDLIVTGPLDELFDRPEPFLILQGANSVNPCKFNGSIWMLRAGYRPDVWSDFSIDAAHKMRFHSFPDDQGWMWHKMPNAAGWKVGSASGVYAFKKPAWPEGDGLPTDARIVAFPGHRDPSQFTHLPWVQEHWKNG